MIPKWVKSPYLFLLIFVAYLLGLWGLSVPLTGDQKVYLSVALEMRERGEWIIPYLFGAANFLKPPFQYWATLLGWKVFGLSTFGAMLPSVIALLLSSLLVKKLYEHFTLKNGNLAGLLFASSLGTMTYGTTAQMEIWIVLFYLASWWLALTGRLFLAFTAVGVMAWIKGPLYSALWVMSYFLYLGIERKLRDFFKPKFLCALFWGIGVGLAWYLLAARTHESEILAVFFKQENVGKLATKQGSPWSLWGEFTYSLFPWVLLLLHSLFKVRVSTKEKNFFIAFALIPAVFFTFFPYRVNTYLYLLTPLAAWIAILGASQERAVRFRYLSLKNLGFFAMGVAVILCFLVYRLAEGAWISWALALSLGVTVFLWAGSHFSKNIETLGLVSLVLVNLIRLGAIELGESEAADFRAFVNGHPLVPIAYAVQDKDIWHEFGMISAAVGHDIQKTYSPEESQAFIEKGGAVIFSDGQTDQSSRYQCQSWRRFKRHLKLPWNEFISKGLSRRDERLNRTFQICTAFITR